MCATPHLSSLPDSQEEAILSDAFGEQWAAYAARTDSVFPGKEAVFRIARMGTVRPGASAREA